jgi:hypothetical protein
MPGAGGHRGSIQGMYGAQSRSPVKESSYLARTESVDEEVRGDGMQGRVESGQGSKDDREAGLKEMSVSPPPMKEGLPIRR